MSHEESAWDRLRNLIDFLDEETSSDDELVFLFNRERFHHSGMTLEDLKSIFEEGNTSPKEG